MPLLKKTMDFLYGTARVRRKYSAGHPDEQVLAADASKGIKTQENKALERGMDWVVSQRAVILLTDKRIRCGKWDIPLEDIESARLFKFYTIYGPGQVLKVETKGEEHYQFGMQMNPEWVEQRVLPLELEQGKLQYSWFSIIVRLILLGYVIYWIIQWIR